MSLAEFVSGLPAGWATTPIYRIGQVYQTKKGPKTSDGKHPLTDASYVKRSPKQSLSYLEQKPEVFGAVGVYSGVRSNGLVIWDADANLATLQRKYGKDLKGPHVLSTKKNAGKWLFYVPEQYWLEVSDLSHAATGAGFEVLWGRQGVLCGAYKDKGEYTTHGDFNAVPDAPEWLIEMMRESYRIKQEGKTNSKLADSRYGSRPREVRVVIAQSCLSVIPNQGRGSEDMWWRIGAAIHSELPTEEGLKLWTDWSKQDAEYADDWEQGDPCAERWSGFEAGKGIGFGTLVRIADEFDPNRERFHRDGCFQVVQEIEAQTLQYKREYLSYEEAMQRGEELMQMEDTAQMNYELHHLALAAGFRDRAALEHVLIERMAPEATGVINLAEIETVEMDYLIPDVVPHPAHILVYGSGGDGKSSACWRLIKHILYGESFLVRGEHVPVKKGKVLIFNGDQPLHLLKNQLKEAEIDLNDVGVINNWNLQSYAKFKRIMDDHKPDLVVFDSLIGCSGGRAFDENKSDFATPLYWLTRNNGAAFPATTMMMIHHANKQGDFRGTSAIRDAVDETWSLKQPNKELVERGELQSHNRIISIEKSRSGRSGTALIMRQEADLTFSLSDFTPAIDKQNTAPSAVIDLVLHRLRTSYPRELTKAELVADQLVGGNKAAITKSLQRLVQRGLISCDSKRGRQLLYKAVLARGEASKTVFFNKKPVVDREVEVDSSVHIDPVVHLRDETDSGAFEGGQSGVVDRGCPPSDVSAGAESPQNGQLGTSIRAGAREEDWDDPELLSKLR